MNQLKTLVIALAWIASSTTLAANPIPDNKTIQTNTDTLRTDTASNKKDKEKDKKVNEYDKLIKKGGSYQRGIFDVRHIDKDWYFEIPESVLGRLFLTVTRF
ncbi:DUF5118 domain-containing protein, partial [Hallella bergensis]|uniref:DUF5118 domain-containing protein n=1 Tax=Hallella bergensis TaxID=242750 RepID=UPI00399068D5